MMKVNYSGSYAFDHKELQIGFRLVCRQGTNTVRRSAARETRLSVRERADVQVSVVF